MSTAGRKVIGQSFTMLSGGTPPMANPSYWGGTIPWVTAKDMRTFRIFDSIDRVTTAGANHGTRLAPKGSVLVLVRGMTLFKSLPVCLCEEAVTFNQDIKALVPAGEMSGEYLAYWLKANESAILRFVEAAGHGTGRLDTDFLKSFPLPDQDANGQAATLGILRTWDHAIDQLDKLIDAKSRHRNAVAHQLLTGRVRFPEFVRNDKVRQTRFGPVPADWEMVPLRSVTTESNARAGTSFTTADIYAVTKTSGIVPMREQIKSRTADRYKIVQPDSFAYNPMRINVGSIARWSGQSEIVVSPDYVVFACDASRLLPAFLDALRPTARWRYFLDVAGSGSVRVRIYFGDLGSFPLALPSLQEQSAIVETLSGIDNEIQLLEAQKSNLGAQKRGLMQKLLTGQWTIGGNHGQR